MNKIFLILFLQILLLSQIKLFEIEEESENEEPEDKLIDLDSKSRPKPDDKDTFYVPVFLTNDIHGYYFWSTQKYNNKEYKSGGLDYLANYLTILRKEFGKERVL